MRTTHEDLDVEAALLACVEEAYALARREVFDVRPEATSVRLSQRQLHLLVKLEAAEAELEEFRSLRRAAVPPRPAALR